ncbi:MAG TPA: thioredoxin domain-containing protein, partial [Gemmatimonadales bacterium]|nr:thioredoxin domain-containing protein [Gemmatimonadales bacterium]
MAGRGRLKNFYLLLGVVVVGGVAALVYTSQTRGSSTTETGPMPVVAADSVPPAAYVIGSDTAPVVIDDYSDFQCPFCAQLAILTFPDVRTRLVNTGIVRWRFHDRPLNIHNKTLRAHLAAACAAEQNKFFPMHDQI